VAVEVEALVEAEARRELKLLAHERGRPAEVAHRLARELDLGGDDRTRHRGVSHFEREQPMFAGVQPGQDRR
jgi:hypothetical protein